MADGIADVLVVEDDPEINELVGAYVELAGYHYIKALAGNDGIREARAHHPAMILLDVMLPDIDGFEVCRRLKSEPSTAGIPIVMLTALDRDELRARGSKAGATAYLTKPFDPDNLIAVIQRVANHGQTPH